MKIVYYPILILLLLLASCDSTPPVGTIAENGMVVSAHPLASEVGVEILRKGGNAVDAAIAVQFALAVVHPSAGNIGGGGFMVYRGYGGDISTLDFREAAPKSAHRNMYLGENEMVIEDLSTRGHLASGVPGTVYGMSLAFERYARLSWKELLQPSIDLAKNGFKLTEMEANGLNYNQENFIKYNTEVPEFVIKEKWRKGDIIYYKDLAKTLERVRDNGRDGFYQGETAELIVEEMERGKGLITMDDLLAYKAVWRNPVVSDYRGSKIISMPPPSSGGIALVQLLKSIENYNMNEFTWHGSEVVHLMTEAERRVYADRATYLGDPDFYPVPGSELISTAYNQNRMADFNPDKATPSQKIAAGKYLVSESDQTTHFSIIDQEGNAVAITTTLNGGYGSKVYVAGAGFLLNNEMDDFSVKPGVPNMFGLVGGEANAIEGGKRMLSSMTPTIIEKDGKLLMVVGTPGGATIITSVFQTIVNVLDFGMGMQEAVEASRFHHQWKPDHIEMEDKALDSKTIKKLIEMGHTIEEAGKIGRVDAILILADGKMEGGADPRGDDVAIGY